MKNIIKKLFSCLMIGTVIFSSIALHAVDAAPNEQKYTHENTIFLDNNSTIKPCGDYAQFLKEMLGIEVSPDEPCYEVQYSAESLDKTELIFSRKISGRQYSEDLNPQSRAEIYPHGLLSGDKLYAEKLAEAKDTKHEEEILREWRQKRAHYWNTQVNAPFRPANMPKRLPHSLLAQKKEGDKLQLHVNGTLVELACIQRYFRLGQRELGIVRNPRFEVYLDFLYKRFNNQLPMTDKEIIAQGGWPIKKTGLESYVFGWKSFFTSEEDWRVLHKEHYKQRWED